MAPKSRRWQITTRPPIVSPTFARSGPRARSTAVSSGLGQPRPANSDFWQRHDRSASKADVYSLRNPARHPGHASPTQEDDHKTQAQTTSSAPRRQPWNKGKLIGQKPPLRPKHVWSIRTRLQMEGRTRDLAMFNLAIDSKLRDCDVVALRVEDVAPSGYAVDRAQCGRRRPVGPSGLS